MDLNRPGSWHTAQSRSTTRPLLLVHSWRLQGVLQECHRSPVTSQPSRLYFLWLRFWLGHVSRTGNASSRAYYKSRGGRALTRALTYIRFRVLKKPHLCSIARVTSHARFCQIQKHGTFFLCLAHTSAHFQNCLKTVLHDSLSILSLTLFNSVGHSFLSASRLSNWPI